MKKTRTYILLILTLLLVGCVKDINQNFLSDNNIEESQVRTVDEYTQMRYRDLETVWENLYLNYRFNNEKYPLDITREDFTTCKEELRGRIPNIKSDIEFYCELQSLVSKLNDGHLSFVLKPELFNQLNIIPFEVEKIEGMWILTGVYKEYEQCLGYELLSINDMPINEIYNKFQDFISYENMYWFDCNFADYVMYADILEYLDIISDSSDNLKIKIRNITDGEIKEANFSVVTGEDYSYYKFSRLNSNIALEKSKYTSYELSEDTYFVELNRCHIDDNYNITKFQNDVISNIEKNDYKKVIIDLRYNLGGLSTTFEDLIDELKKLQTLERFDVYTLIGNATFSSGVATAAYINKNLINTFVGSPTGGKPNSFGASNLKELESHIDLNCTYIYYEFVPYDDMMTIYPDITVEQTYEDFINNKDTVVDYVLLRE